MFCVTDALSDTISHSQQHASVQLFIATFLRIGDHSLDQIKMSTTENKVHSLALFSSTNRRNFGREREARMAQSKPVWNQSRILEKKGLRSWFRWIKNKLGSRVIMWDHVAETSSRTKNQKPTTKCGATADFRFQLLGFLKSLVPRPFPKPIFSNFLFEVATLATYLESQCNVLRPRPRIWPSPRRIFSLKTATYLLYDSH